MPPTRVKPRKPNIISLDTETPGVDFFHGCKPFLVTSCNEDGETLFWEWDVDPLTREVHVLKEDVEQIHSIIQDADQLVLHNAKFDVKALATVIPNLRWPWEKTHDTLIAAHLLGSNYPKNLTDLAMNWLGIDILPFEKSLEHAVKECRKVIQLSKVRVKRFNEKEGRDLFEEQGSRGIEAFDEWRIGEDDDPMLPSGGGWKSDYWLPRAMAKHQDLPQDDPYWTVLSSYANQDSPVTLALWFAMRKEIERRGLWAHYQEGLDVQKVVAEMESRPVTINKKRTAELRKQYETSSQKSHDECVRLSDGEITKMPISGRSNDLNRVVFDKLGLVSNKVTKKNNASMDKYVLEEWLLTLDPSTTQWQFINHLNRYRKRRTALGYLESYQKFWISDEKHLEWANLYMTLNQTGTDTLRFTMANPNGQQVSKKEIKEDGEEGHSARYMFGPAPGREWWSLDYENIELRIPAYVAGEELMIDLFERPNDPPYFGSYHLAIFDILHPEMFKKHGVDVKDLFADTWYGWTKNGNFACVPMKTEALTRQGFKTYDQLNVGDDVLGYKDGELHWTPVRKKFTFEDAPLIRMENNHFSVESTPDHRWIAKKRVGGRNTRRIEECITTTSNMTKEHSLVLSATVKDESLLDITNEEAEIIGFVYGDGSVIKSKKGDGPSRGKDGSKIGFSVKIFQKKPEGLEYLDDLMERWGGPYKKYIRPSGIVSYVLNPEMCRSIWKRAGLWESQDFETFVLRLGTSQRKAFLDSVYEAEGYLDGCRHNTRLFAQNKGSFADGIKLAVFMCGRWPTVIECKNYYGSSHTQTAIRECKPYVTGQRIEKTNLDGGHKVWCIQTDLDSWVMRQDDSITLTGNCQYGAVAESGTADRAYHVEGAQRIIETRLTKIKALSQRMIAQANRTGYVETLPDKTTGGVRGYPLLCTRTMRGDVKPTVPLSYMIQGSAMGCTRRAMIRCREQCRKWTMREKRLHYIPLQVHDEIVFDLPAGGKKNVEKILTLKSLMESSGDDIGIPLKVSVKYNPVSWDKGIKLSEIKD